MLQHVRVVAKRLCAAAVAETAAAHEGDDNTPSGPTGRGVKITRKPFLNTAINYFFNQLPFSSHEKNLNLENKTF